MPTPNPFRRLFRPCWPVIHLDLSQGSARWKLGLAALGLAMLSLAFLVGGYEVYHYTESTEFCGTVCHTMEPQRVRHELSPHSNVECAKCHIGPGFDAFVRSKIEGTRELYTLATNTYHNPIISPVKNLRPAREICESCHSPGTFKDNITKTNQHFDDDRENTPIRNNLILKMGGWQEEDGIIQSIHWHIGNEVYYIPLDEQRQVIAWVGILQPDGSFKEFYASDMIGMAQIGFVQKARDEGRVRLLDCIDCHNRVAHYIPYPEQAVDRAIASGLISRDLPFIRARAVEILQTKYSSEAEAMAAIDALGVEYSSQTVMGIGTGGTEREKIQRAVEELKKIYATTNFPEMKLDWATNPNNERHNPTAGCFRCHDDRHFSTGSQGAQEVIRGDCNLCHTVPIVGRGTDMLVEAPVIVGPVPRSHSDYSWTVQHRSISEAEAETCLNCHGRSFCSNSVCHNLSHPEDMLFTHAEEYRRQGDGQTCYACHQNVTCERCHPAGIIQNP